MMDAEREQDLRRELLMQRLAHLEAERVAAVFAVEQIDESIASARRQLGGTENGRGDGRAGD